MVVSMVAKMVVLLEQMKADQLVVLKVALKAVLLVEW